MWNVKVLAQTFQNHKQGKRFQKICRSLGSQGQTCWYTLKGLVTGNTRMKCQSFILQATSCEGYFFNRPTFSQSDIPFCIPHATSCWGYNVFDPSVRQSVCQSCFSCQRNSSETAQQNFVKLCSYEKHNV